MNIKEKYTQPNEKPQCISKNINTKKENILTEKRNTITKSQYVKHPDSAKKEQDKENQIRSKSTRPAKDLNLIGLSFYEIIKGLLQTAMHKKLMIWHFKANKLNNDLEDSILSN